jgi:hypothetical protein
MRRGCRVIPAWLVAAVEISNYGSVSGAHGTADSHCYARLVITVGDLHTAESFSDSLASKR